VIFESNGNLKIILKGLIITVVSLLIWFLTALRFFVSYGGMAISSIYNGDIWGAIKAASANLSTLLNPIRLWGSTWNCQFETYFPKELTLLSFLPILVAVIAIVLRPRDKRVLFSLSAYLFVSVPYLVYQNLDFLVHNIPFGSIFQIPCVFLVPACLGLALLIRYTNQTISGMSTKFAKATPHSLVRVASFVVILILIIAASIPWWTGQASGNPILGPPTKLNLYQTPSGYVEWSSAVKPDNEYLVLYIPLAENVEIMNTSYFSLPYEGVSGAIFTEVNNLPYVSAANTTSIINELFNGTSDVGKSWGSYSIKYIVVYRDVISDYNMTDLMSRLSKQSGIVEAANLPGVIVYQNEYAKPIIYANSSNATTQITYQDPTSYKVKASSTSPYILVLNQVYSGGWVASVNGTRLPTTTHTKDGNGFNSWYINYTGTMTVDIYYEPQTAYLISTIVSISVLIMIVLYIVLVTIRNMFRQAHK